MATDPGIRQREVAVEFLPTRLDGYVFGATVLVRVGLIDDAFGDRDRHSADGVDHRRKTRQVDLCVVVNVNTKDESKRCLEGVDRWFLRAGERIGVPLGVRPQVGDDVRKAAAAPDSHPVRERRFGEIAGNREHRRVAGGSVDAQKDDRVRTSPGTAHTGVAPEKEDVDSVEIAPDSGRLGGRAR